MRKGSAKTQCVLLWSQGPIKGTRSFTLKGPEIGVDYIEGQKAT